MGGSPLPVPPRRFCVSGSPRRVRGEGKKGEEPPHAPSSLAPVPTPPPACPTPPLPRVGSLYKVPLKNEEAGIKDPMRVCVYVWGGTLGHWEGGDIVGGGMGGPAREGPGGPFKGQAAPLCSQATPSPRSSPERPAPFPRGRAPLRPRRDDARRRGRGPRAASRIAPSQDGGAGSAGFHPELHGAAARRRRRRDAAPGAGSAGLGRTRRHRGGVWGTDRAGRGGERRVPALRPHNPPTPGAHPHARPRPPRAAGSASSLGTRSLS